MIAFVYTVVPFLICRGESCFGNANGKITRDLDTCHTDSHDSDLELCGQHLRPNDIFQRGVPGKRRISKLLKKLTLVVLAGLTPFPPTGVQLPNTMADLNEQLQGLQNQINDHFDKPSSNPKTEVLSSDQVELPPPQSYSQLLFVISMLIKKANISCLSTQHDTLIQLKIEQLLTL